MRTTLLLLLLALLLAACTSYRPAPGEFMRRYGGTIGSP